MVAQVALSVVLITGAGLFLRTLQKLWTVDAGFDRRQCAHVLGGCQARGLPGRPRRFRVSRDSAQAGGPAGSEIRRRIRGPAPGRRLPSAGRGERDRWPQAARAQHRSCGVECHESGLFLHCLHARLSRDATSSRATTKPRPKLSSSTNRLPAACFRTEIRSVTGSPKPPSWAS